MVHEKILLSHDGFFFEHSKSSEQKPSDQTPLLLVVVKNVLFCFVKRKTLSHFDLPRVTAHFLFRVLAKKTLGCKRS